MITIICGTNGSGKSHLVRTIKNSFGPPLEKLSLPAARDGLGGYRWPGRAIVGVYESFALGCDSFKKGNKWPNPNEDVMALILTQAQQGDHVLMEGLTIGSWGVERLKRLLPYDLLIIHLTTPLEECIAGVKARHALLDRYQARRDPRPLDTEYLSKKHHTLQTVIALRRQHGIPLEELSRDQARQRAEERMPL